MSEYDNFKKYIKEKSGIDVGFLKGDDTADNIRDFTASGKGVFSDAAAGKTFFIIHFRGKNTVAFITGAGETENKLALLISEIAENFFVKEGLNRAEFIRSLLLGEMSTAQIGRYAAVFSFPKYPAFVMLFVYSAGDAEDVKNVFLNYGVNSADVFVPLSQTECAVVKFCDRLSDEYRSQGEYAEYLKQTVYEETGVSLSIYIGGKVDRIADLPVSFTQAKAAREFDPNAGEFGEIHSYKEYALMGLIEEIPKNKLKEYLAILTDENSKEIFTDKEMVTTAEEFLNNSLNVSETARILYLHRNTLIYRLDKIEKATGLNIRKFSDAVTFRLITYLNKLDKG